MSPLYHQQPLLSQTLPHLNVAPPGQAGQPQPFVPSATSLSTAPGGAGVPSLGASGTAADAGIGGVSGLGGLGTGGIGSVGTSFGAGGLGGSRAAAAPNGMASMPSGMPALHQSQIFIPNSQAPAFGPPHMKYN